MTLKLAAFFSQDIRLLSSATVPDAADSSVRRSVLDLIEGAGSRLALDFDVAGRYQKKGLTYSMPFQLLGDARIEDIQARMYDIFTQLRDRAWPEGLWSANWPGQDYFALALNLSTALIAEGVAAWFLKEKGSELYFFQRTPCRGVTSDALPNDVAASVWSTMLPHAARPLLSDMPVPETRTRPSDYSLLKNNVCFFMHEFEQFRMAPFVAHTAGKKEVAVVSLNATHFTPMQVTGRVLPTLFQPPCEPVPVPGEAAASLAAFWAEKLPPGLEWLMRWFLLERWARFEAGFQQWRRILREHPPSLCMVSESILAEFDVIILAARECGIPVVSIAHSAMNPHMPDSPRPLATDAALFASPIMARLQNRNTPHIPSYSIRQLRHEMEYPTSAKAEIHKKKNHVLVVTTVIQGIDIFWYAGLPDRHISQLTEFHALSREREQVSVCYKGHPGRPEFPLLTLAGIAEEQFLAADTNMQSALDGVSVVVMYNYRGSPLISAMKRGIPVITLITNPPYEAFGRMVDTDYFQKDLRGDIETATAREAWEAIDRLCVDDAWRQELLERQREFVQKSFGLGATSWFVLMEALLEGKKIAVPDVWQG